LTITGSSGAQYTFPTGSGTNSLSGLAQAINSSAAGVTASVINDATGSRLALVSNSAGSASDFSVSYGVANASSWSSVSLASANTPLTAGSFQIGDGSSSATINVGANDTLTTVAQTINTQNLGLTASVVSDSSGAHLQLNAQSGSSISLSADPAFSFTRASTAANASLTVDGVPVSSATNTVTGAISGVTLNLNATTSAGNPASLDVAADTSTIQQALSQFVSDYNSALSTVSSQFTYSTSTSSQGALSGSSDIRSLQSILLGIGGYSASSGSSAASSAATVNTLSDLGITMNDDGTLSLNTSTLSQALQNPSAVQNFFQGASLNGFAQQFETQIGLFGDPGSGSIAQEIGNPEPAVQRTRQPSHQLRERLHRFSEDAAHRNVQPG
jgi:flagellar hook-associated protein 2